MPTQTVVQIAVEQAAFSYDKLYSYLWPSGFGIPQVGLRVLVPFGSGDRRRQGLVMDCTQPDTVPPRLKTVAAVIDEQPLLNEEMLALARFMQERTFCTLFDAVRAMLPTGLYMKVKAVLRPAADVPPEVLENLTSDERQIVAFVSKCSGGADQATLLKRLGMDEDSPALENLLRLGVLCRGEDAFRQWGDATVRTVRLISQPADSQPPKLTDKQQSVLSLLEDVGAASVKEVCYFTGVTAAVVQALARKGLVELYDAEVLRAPYEQAAAAPTAPPVTLSDSQQQAFDRLLALYQSGQPSAALLYGVTGSGKTAVYMSLIDRVLEDDRQVIVLVPEISLTPQMMALFLRKYGRRVAVLHSGLSIGERMDEWKRIKRGDARIVVGTRSAVFAPCDRVGLIILDEEQEHTYKSESAPRYHARDMARFRCAHQDALLLLTSATPSMESYHAAVSGRYTLVELPSRYGQATLPEVQVVDRRQEPMGDTSIGPTLLSEMRACLENGRQVILLLNRRGFHTNLSCRSCGQTVSCPSCSIAMTYHRANERLMCHYCGHSQRPPVQCPVCGSDKLRYAGLGTQRVEEELAELFPDEPVLRMDTDTTMSRQSYEEKFTAFARGDYRIMIGTQMVAKGLDFPHVGLVGVLSADQSLYGDDYRSFETTFALLTQVIGRAGRREQQGKAVIQTYTPDNPVIELASQQDYTGFYQLEIASRKMLHYPPYADLIQFGFSGISEGAVRQAALWMLAQLRTAATGEFSDLPVIALDPTPASILRVAGKFRYKLLLKARNTTRMRELIRQLLRDFHAQPANRAVSVTVDINPASML
ncbi:MAG: primosomal protein N' [Clostridia bacterium]|nr:primosomal protein N' [Clostridia bacterium]